MAFRYLEMDSSFFRILRFVRLGRALRGIRVIRLIHYVGALRTLVWPGGGRRGAAKEVGSKRG